MTSYAETLLASAATLGAWRDLPFFSDGSLGKIAEKIGDGDQVLPAPGHVFEALRRVPPEDVRVVILGQDPYPTQGHPHGLAFSVERGVTPLPRSLGNIFKEMRGDIGEAPKHGDLSHWADQGVLLLNTALTVRAGEPASHARLGWTALTDQIVADLASRDGLVWVLWGGHARAFRQWIEAGSGTHRLIIESVHPSPLSAQRGFFGSKPFSRINAHLAQRGGAKIDWVG